MKTKFTEMGPVVNVKVKKVSNANITDDDDILAVEEPLEITVVYRQGQERIKKIVSVTMRTPGNDEELGAGFLFTEGIMQKRDQIKELALNENKLTVTLNENEVPVLQNAERNFYTTSSCGVCGKASIDAINTVSFYKNAGDKLQINSETFYGLHETLRKHQEIFESTGGLHASALFETNGNFILLREDVGRHNALDKVIGAAFLNDRLPLNDKILLLSGRASFELIQKASMAGIKVVAAVGAPSSLAVKLAKDSGITLTGFLRKERFNIYSGDQRIKFQ